MGRITFFFASLLLVVMACGDDNGAEEVGLSEWATRTCGAFSLLADAQDVEYSQLETVAAARLILRRDLPPLLDRASGMLASLEDVRPPPEARDTHRALTRSIGGLRSAATSLAVLAEEGEDAELVAGLVEFAARIEDITERADDETDDEQEALAALRLACLPPPPRT